MPKPDNGPPRGTRDFLPEEVSRRERLISSLVAAYERFGFRRIDTPALEDIARLTSSGEGENEKLIYKVLRRGLDPVIERAALDDLVDLGLRFDLTVPLSRFYANNRGRLPAPFRAMQVGSVWRAERPQRGRYRQFTQCDIDTLGEATELAEAELLEATMSALCDVGAGPVEARVNDRRLLFAVATAAGVEPGRAPAYLVRLDRLDRVGWEGVRAELEKQGFPGSVGAESERIIGLLESTGSARELLDRASDLLPHLDGAVLEGLDRTAAATQRLCGEGGLDQASFRIDPTIVRGLGYYSGQIFELRHPGVSGSIAGGGRYDGLVGRFLGEGGDVPACGISVGFERVVDLISMPVPDLGVALLYDAESPAESVLAAARSIRGGGRRVALVPLRSNEGRQLRDLAGEGFTSAVRMVSGEAGPELAISKSSQKARG
ncbi:MAG: histidine--tRNA ligase [Acidimicrobiales bacterium]